MATGKITLPDNDSLEHVLSQSIVSLSVDVELYSYILSIQECLPDVIPTEGENISKEEVVAILEREVTRLNAKISLLEGIEQLLASME